ncbi:MAG: hypothetical protein LBD17_03725, partial [Endomicrobium sp.]|nr:hypothetical protein [Endomicrobium sp.]
MKEPRQFRSKNSINTSSLVKPSFWVNITLASIFVILIIALEFMFVEGEAFATDLRYFTWEGTGTPSTWSDTAGKWTTSDYVNSAGNILTFTGNGETVTIIDSAKQFSAINFSANGYTIEGEDVYLFPTDGAYHIVSVEESVTAYINSSICSYATILNKLGSGVVVLGSSNNDIEIFFITEGDLRLNNIKLETAALDLFSNGTLSGSGSFNSTISSTYNGTISPGDNVSYGTLTFESGLYLESSSKLVFDLLQEGTAGVDYDHIRVSGGTFSSDCALVVNAKSPGTYNLINYAGANLNTGSYFSSSEYFLNGERAIAILKYENNLITTTIIAPSSTAMIWEGKGDSYDWSNTQARFIGDYEFTNKPGILLYFTGKGDSINNLISHDFDTLIFNSSGYEISGDSFSINPLTGSYGTIYVLPGVHATINTAIVGQNRRLQKFGTGILSLGSKNNSYTGYTEVNEGELRLENGNMPKGMLIVFANGTFSGVGTVQGETVIYGTLSPGLADTQGTLSFVSGLTLGDESRTIFNLKDVDSLTNQIETVVVSAGSFNLGGTLSVNAQSAGTYNVFNYQGASLSRGTNFKTLEFYLDGKPTQGTLTIDVDNKLVTVTLEPVAETVRREIWNWQGTGVSSEWSLTQGRWADGVNYNNNSGHVLNFAQSGESVISSQG